MRELHRRMPWAEVPADIRDAVGEVLGAPIVTAVSQSGGFSPGSADRVVTASGRRGFVKTGYARVNPEICDIHRREAAVAALLPETMPVSTFAGFVDRGEWVAIVFDEVDGRPPGEPWNDADLVAALDAYADLAAAPVAPELHAILDDAQPRMRELAETWDAPAIVGGEALNRLPPDLAPWVAARRLLLRDVAHAAAEAASGDRLVHFDARADNVLIRPGGSAVVVDWPWALRGAGWIDPLMLLATVRLHREVTPAMLTHRAFDALPNGLADGILAALGGFMLLRSAGPPAPGIPTLRAFQLDQAVACLRWVRERGVLV